MPYTTEHNDESIQTGADPLVSVIVPFYNVAPYVAECLDSLVNQDFDSYEVVCIDDGSDDGTGEILDAYAERYSFVKTYHFQNEGLSVARNRGLKLSRAELVSFVDGDDFVSPYYLSTLYGAYGGVEGRLVHGKLLRGCRDPWRYVTWPHPSECPPLVSYSGVKMHRDLFVGRLSVVAWAKLAHRSLYEEVPFTPGVVYEDVMVAPDLAEHINEILLVDLPIYVHRRRQGSLSRPRTITEKHIAEYLAAQRHFIEVAQGWEDEVRDLIPWKMAAAYSSVVGMAMELPDRAAAWRYIEEAQGYIRQHFVQVLRLRRKHSFRWRKVARCALAVASPTLYAFVRRVRRRM